MKQLLFVPRLLISCATQPVDRERAQADFECRKESAFAGVPAPNTGNATGVIAGRIARSAKPQLDLDMYRACMQSRGY